MQIVRWSYFGTCQNSQLTNPLDFTAVIPTTNFNHVKIIIFQNPNFTFFCKSWQHCLLYVCLRESYHGNVRCWSYLKTASFLYLAVERCSLHFNEKSISLQAFPGLNEIPTLFIFTCIIMMFYVSCVHRGHLPERE